MILSIGLLYKTLARHKVITGAYLSSIIVLAFSSIGELYVTRGITNYIIAFLKSSSVSVKPLIFLLLIQVFVEIIGYGFNLFITNYLSIVLSSEAQSLSMENLYNSFWTNTGNSIQDEAEYSRLAVGEESIRQYVTKLPTLIFSTLQGFLSIAIYFSVIQYFSNWISVVVLGLVVPNVLMDLYLAKKNLDLLETVSPISRHLFRLTNLICSIPGIQDTLIFQHGPVILAKWKHLFLRTVNARIGTQLSIFKVSTVVQLLQYLFSAVVVIALVLHGRTNLLSTGTVLALIQAVSGLQQNMSRVFTTISQLYVSLTTARKILKEDRTVVKRRVHQELRSLVVNHLWYKYPSQNSFSLQDVSLAVLRGEKIAIVGQNGSGKSTLVKCLLQTCIPTNGSITFYGESKEITREECRIGVVFQDFVIYPISLAENITIGNPNKPSLDEEIVNLLKAIGGHSILDKLGGNLNAILDPTIIGGVGLSHGELQKIAICRALYSDPDILFLDEPSASLDPLSEQLIYQVISKYMEQKTVVLISHRLQVCESADRILLLERGKIVDTGSHSTLMGRSKLYQQMNESERMIQI